MGTCPAVKGGWCDSPACVDKCAAGVSNATTPQSPAMSLPTGTAARKNIPMARGLLDYFPAALAAVAALSQAGNDKHNPGQDLHWARGKSMDHENKIIRHLMDAGTLDTDGTRHSAKVAWRALAMLQEELEREEGAPLPRNARLPDVGRLIDSVSMDVPYAAYDAHPGSLNLPSDADGS